MNKRWWALAIFTIANAIAFLDRQLLAAFQPTLQAEFHLTSAQYGWIVGAFSALYGFVAPASGLILDRFGLNTGISIAIAVWSFAGIATGFATGFRSLAACRAALGAAESATIPAAGKAVALYSEPGERALGAAVGQIGISLGMVSAPVLASLFAPVYGWRFAFILSGMLGFLWIPLWLATSRRIPHRAEPVATKASPLDLVRDRRLWALVAATMLGMSVYSLWSNWTTKFFVMTYSLPESQANLGFAWVPPVFAALGGVTGGMISLRLARGGDLLHARYRAILIAGVALLATAAVPHLPSPALATAAICWSFF